MKFNGELDFKGHAMESHRERPRRASGVRTDGRQAMNIQIPEPIQYVLDTLHAQGYEAFVVGGCVRDSLLRKEPADWDVTTSALPKETKACFPRTADTGIQHGTVSVILNHEPVEVTTYRIDGTYSDGRHPDAVSFARTLREDLARRDFTINAMAYDQEHGLVDPYGGQADLAQGLIRCVGDPEKRFGEDALRILRALRFASVLGFSIENTTESAIYDMAERARQVAVERICVEFQKLLLGDHADLILSEYRGVLSRATGLSIPAGTDVDRLPRDFAVRLASLDGVNPKVLKCDNKTNHLVKDIREGLEEVRDQDELNRARLRYLLRDYSPEGVRGALGILGDGKTLELLEQILADGDCYSLRQLAVTGSELGLSQGPAIGRRLSTLLEEVLEGALPNEREALLARSRELDESGQNSPIFRDGNLH